MGTTSVVQAAVHGHHISGVGSKEKLHMPRNYNIQKKIFFYPMPHMSFTDFVIFPPGHGRSVTNF